MDKNSMGVIIIYVVFLAVLILPTYFANKKKKKQKAELMENLKVGAKITTVGGIQGTITTVFTDTVEMKIDKNARMTVLKSAVERIETK